MLKTAAIITGLGVMGLAPVPAHVQAPVLASTPSAFEAELTRLDNPIHSTEFQMSYISVKTDGDTVEAAIAPTADFSLNFKTKGGLKIRIGF